MAEILIKAVSIIHTNLDKDRSGCYKKGYPVVVMPDGHSWGSEETLPKFVLIKCPEVTVEQVRPYIDLWRDDFLYTLVSQNAAQGLYTVRVQNNSTSVSGVNRLTLNRVESFLLNWGCNNISFVSPYVQFDFRLWNAVRSDGFWNKENIDDYASFALDSYNATTGVGVITATVYNIPEKIVINKIQELGGTVISHAGNVYQFSIERTDIFNKFKAEIKSLAERIFCRRKYYISESAVDSIAAAGGSVVLSKTQLLAIIKNKLND